MKKIIGLAAGSLMLLASLVPSYGWHKEGRVLCDVNANGVIDAEDLPVQGVLVVVQNVNGAPYTSSAWTANDGSFWIQLPDYPGTFRGYIRADTLPAGTTAVLPADDVFTTTDTVRFIVNNFLIQNPECGAKAKCWLTGGGTIEKSGGQPVYSYGGVVNPGCSAIAAGGGNWNVIWHAANLHFKGLNIQVITCGNLDGYSPGSSSPKTPYNYIDFEGVGSLTGISGNNANYGIVYFTARAVDLKEGGRLTDQLYLRVCDAGDNTLMLISTDQANPETIAPVAISTGNLQLHISSCSK